MKNLDLAVSWATTLAVFLGGAATLLAAETGPPFPAALKAAAVHVAKLPNPQEKTVVTSGTCELDRAVATVVTDRDTTEIRVLAQSNVVLIRSARPLSLAGPLSFLRNKDLGEWARPAEPGAKEGLVYLHQPIPGDEDASGMEVYVVAGRQGELQAVAVVTSRDDRDPLAAAMALVHDTLADANAVAQHEAAWCDFWSTSGIELADAELQNWWYRMLYFNRTFARTGGNAVGLAANFTGLAGWHNSLKLNYNIQQT